MGDIIIGNMDSIQLLKWIVVLVIEGELIFAKSSTHRSSNIASQGLINLGTSTGIGYNTYFLLHQKCVRYRGRNSCWWWDNYQLDLQSSLVHSRPAGCSLKKD